MDKQECVSIMTTDITVQDAGSIVLLQPHTGTAKRWLEENIGQDNGFQPYWPTVVVEPRYLGEIIEGMQADGLIVIEGGG